MNALARTALPRAANMATMAPRRCNSTFAIVRRMKEEDSFAKTWLMDKGAYPVMVICVVAPVAAFSFIGYKFTTCPNVRVTSKTKGRVLRDW